MKRILTAVVAITVLAGCGAVAERAAEEVAEQALEQAVEGDSNGDVDIEFGGGDLPDELTVEVPGGYEVLGSSSFSDEESSIISTSLIYPGNDVDDIVEYFEDYFAGQEGISTSESSSDAFSNWTWSTDDASTIVGVSHSEEDNEVMVNVTERTTG